MKNNSLFSVVWQGQLPRGHPSTFQHPAVDRYPGGTDGPYGGLRGTLRTHDAASGALPDDPPPHAAGRRPGLGCHLWTVSLSEWSLDGVYAEAASREDGCFSSRLHSYLLITVEDLKSRS